MKIMKNNIFLSYLEVKYLFKQKFLWLLLLIGFAIIVYRMPKFNYEMNYHIFEESKQEQSYESMSESERLIVDYWNEKKTYIETHRLEIYEQASKKKEILEERIGFEYEYLTKIENLFSKTIDLDVQDYLGWEIFFLHQTSMSPHSPVCLLEMVLIVSAGLLLFTKDKENNTLFWASITGRGATFASYVLKIIIVIFYAIFIQVLFNGIYIIGLGLVCGLDMRHWFNLIQNIPQYGMCDVQLNIFGTIVIDILLKCLLCLIILMGILVFSQILRKYLFMFMSILGVSGILYYWLYVMCQRNSYGMWWYINPFSIFQLDKILTYDAICIMNHAVDVRVIMGGTWLGILTVLSIVSYQVWRKYINVSSS